MTHAARSTQSLSEGNANETPAWGGLLAAWILLSAGLHGVIWATGARQYELAEAVEQGAARAEQRLIGEESPDVISKEIRLQRETLRFWKVLALLGDLLFGPVTLALRAMLVATAFSASAALSGRRSRFPIVMADCVRWQGVWVLALTVQVVLMFVLNEDRISTSITVLLPVASFSAPAWVGLNRIDLFAVVGWFGMAWSGYRRGQANAAVAVLVCLALAVLEGAVWTAVVLLFNLSMRLSVMPQ